MEGITLIKDETNNKPYLQFDFDLVERMSTEEIEDLFDVAIAESRMNDETVPFEEVVAGLKAKGIITDEL